MNDFLIPANFEDSGKIMGFFSMRNVVEAVIPALLFAFIIDIATLFSIMHCFENDESLEQTNRLIYDFSNDWMNKCRLQTQSEYNEYKKMFMLYNDNVSCMPTRSYLYAF